MPTVAIIGAGELGAAVAQALASAGRVDSVVLVDPAGDVAAGKALDLQQSGAITGSATRLTATTDISVVVGARVCVLADDHRAPDLDREVEDGVRLVERLRGYAPHAPLLLAGPAPLDIMRLAGRMPGERPRRLIGSAPEAFASAARALAALEVGCAAPDVSLTVLGVPPRFVIPWSEATASGAAIEHALTAAQLARLEARVALAWPPGPNTLGLAAARVVEALLRTSRRRLSVYAWLDHGGAWRHDVAAVPARVGHEGVLDVSLPTLTSRDRVRLESTLGG